MASAEFKILFYDKPDGVEPAKDFLDALDAKMFVKIFRAIDLLKSEGPTVREPYSKHVSDGIFEIRAQIGTDISRVLYFFYSGRNIILTHGFIKKTQKIPPSELDRAKKYRTEYLGREVNKNDKFR